MGLFQIRIAAADCQGAAIVEDTSDLVQGWSRTFRTDAEGESLIHITAYGTPLDTGEG